MISPYKIELVRSIGEIAGEIKQTIQDLKGVKEGHVFVPYLEYQLCELLQKIVHILTWQEEKDEKDNREITD